MAKAFAIKEVKKEKKTLVFDKKLRAFVSVSSTGKKEIVGFKK